MKVVHKERTDGILNTGHLLMFKTSYMCMGNLKSGLQEMQLQAVVWTEKLSLGRHNGLDCTFRKWSCNPVCMEKENRSCGLKSAESQWPNTMQHKWHPFSQRGSRLIEPGNSITLSTQKQPLLPSPSSTLELRSNGRAAKNSYIVHGL